MKTMLALLIALMCIPVFAGAQTDSTNADQQLKQQIADLQKQLDQMQKNLDAQMKQLNVQIQGMDSFSIQMPDEQNMKIVIDTTVVKIGKWDVGVKDSDEVVKIIVNGKDDACCEDSTDAPDEDLKNVKTQFFLLDLGLTSYIDQAGGNFGSVADPSYNFLELKPNSMQVGLHIFRQRINLVQHKFNFEYGLQLQFNNYKFSQSFTLVPDTNMVSAVSTDLSLKKNKLTDCYLNLPVMFNFTSNPFNLKKSFTLGAGAFGGYLIGSHSKQVSDADGKVKMKDDYNLNPLQYGFTGYIGYGGFKIYGNYSLTNMFKDDVMPALTPLSVGLVLLGWD